MKICGCKSCKDRGEINLYENFELYYSTRDLEAQAIFEDTLGRILSVQQLHDFELEFAGQHISNVVNRINEAVPFDAQTYWTKYGGSLRGFQKLNEN